MGSYTHQGLSEVAKIYPQSYNPWGGQKDQLLSYFYFKIRQKLGQKIY